MDTWVYYIAKAEDGTVLSIARRSGPEIQVLAATGDWVDRPQLLERFQDPGYYVPQALVDAQADARTLGISWPAA